MTVTGKSAYKIQTYSDAQSFERLAEAWNDLTDRDKDCTVFQTWTWVSHMWKLEAQGHVLLRLVAIAGEEDKLVALAPMLIERRFGPMGVRVLRFIGYRMSDRQDVIVASDADEGAVIDLLAVWFKSAVRDCDIVVLDNLSETSKLVRHREVLFPKQRYADGNLEVVDHYFYIPVVGSWERYCTGLKKVGQEIRRKKRRLEEGHKVTFWIEDGSIESRRSITEFVQLHQLRQESKKERGLFRTSTREQFLSNLFDAMLKDGKLKLRFINVDGSPKAIQAVLEFKDRSHWYSVGLDTTASTLRLGLGKLLCFTAVEDAFRTGKAEVDLGNGVEPYKTDFASHLRKTYRIVRYYSSMKGLFYRLHGRILRSAQYSKWIRNLYFLFKSWRLSASREP